MDKNTELPVNNGKFCATIYSQRFGNWNKFLESIGEKALDRKEKNKAPTLQELVNNGKFCATIYSQRFGNWNKFLEFIGEKVWDRKEKKISDEELIENYFNVKKEYKR